MPSRAFQQATLLGSDGILNTADLAGLATVATTGSYSDLTNKPTLLTWQSVQTTGFTAVAGRAYPCNTTSAAFTVTLPASPSAGDLVTLTDYAGTFATNNLTVNPNGNKVEGFTANQTVYTNRGSVNLVYIDSTQGWIIYANVATDIISPATVSVDYLVVAGGAGGGGGHGGGGGAGGYRTASAVVLNVNTAYTVTVGGGGTGGSGYFPGNGVAGSNSVFGTITSTGGGFGASYQGGSTGTGGSGGSGGGGGGQTTGLGGSATSGQGNAGGSGTTSGSAGGGGGGGASAIGTNGSSGGGGNGGNGTASSISGSSVTYAGGGGGGAGTPGIAGLGGTGGGAAGYGGAGNVTGSSGTANTGGGGGGGGGGGSYGFGGTGGSGVVIIAYPDTYPALASIGAGLTYDQPTRAGYRVYRFTAGTGTISW